MMSPKQQYHYIRICFSFNFHKFFIQYFIMFKKNQNRPPITISLRKVNSGYKVVSNDGYNPFSFKKITRAIFKNELHNAKGNDPLISSVMPNSSLVQPPSHITMPLSAKWFEFDEIHNIEKEAFPEFFCQEDQECRLFKKSPKLYRFYRNFIISLWRQNSKKYLSPSVCRKNLPGDVSAIIRIHSFLQHWGLINFPSKEHNKGYVDSKSQDYFCHVCQETMASEYYVCKIEEAVHFQICNCCYIGGLYPTVLKTLEFRKVIPQAHEEEKKKRMTPEQIQKMLEIVNSQNTRDKQLWSNLAVAFPQYSKQEILYNFLLTPSVCKMNANIFSNHEDIIEEKEPFSESPTIFQDYEDQIQLSVANSYYVWKNSENKQLDDLFTHACGHAEYLAAVQHQKCGEMTRMLIDVQQSKLELKTLFLQQLEKLTDSQAQSFKLIAANIAAEEIKNHEIDFE